MLDLALQDGKNIPKFNRRRQLGQFVGFSPTHSSLVALVRNLTTGFVSPQYHVVFDDNFYTVFGNPSQSELETLECIIWRKSYAFALHSSAFVRGVVN